jgi:elongation factor Ts
MAVSAQDVKKLRERTGAGMMDCKKALSESDGDMEQAIEYLRKKGQKVSEKRADREASEGGVFVAISDSGQSGLILELNCETDFVGKNEDFKDLGQKIADAALAGGANDLEALGEVEVDGKPVNQQLTDAMARIGEKITVSKLETLAAERVVSYIHIGGKIGVLVGFRNIDGVDNIEEVGSNVAMQIAAMNPVALDQNDVPQDLVEKERSIALEQIKNEPKNANKPQEILEKIVNGKIQKYFKENTVLNQEFVKDPQQTVREYLQSHKKDLEVVGYKRLHLG